MRYANLALIVVAAATVAAAAHQEQHSYVPPEGFVPDSITSTADLGLAAQQPREIASIPSPQTSRLLPSGCLSSGQTRLRGVLRKELHLGPPGYGENRATDERDTVVALILPAAISLCRDSPTDERRPSAIVDRRISLWHVTELALDAAGQTVTVYGFLHEAAYAHEFGPLVMQVDSVTDLRPMRPGTAI